MRSKDHLFHLIKSLSKSEKRYFTLDAQKSGRKQSRYLTLFQAINDQEEYTEKPLKKTFGPKLGDDKARLYEAILRSMRDYQSKKSYKTRIKELLTDAKILFERKLYEQAENRLAEAKGLALELEDHLAVLEINLRQRQLIKEYQNRDYSEQVEELINEKKKHLQILEQEFWFHDNYDRLSVDLLRFPQKLTQTEVSLFDEKYKPIVNFKPTEDSIDIKRRYFQIQALYHQLLGNNDEVLDYFEKTVFAWEGNQKAQAEDFFNYIGDVANLMYAFSRKEEKLVDLYELLADLKTQTPPTFQAEKILFERTTIYELIYLLNTKSVKFSETLKVIENGLKKYEVTPSSEVSILFNTVLLLFLSDQYQECVEWLKKLWSIQRKTKNIRQDIQDASRIIYLLAIYKYASFDQIENALRSIKRYFSNRKTDSLKLLLVLISETITSLQNTVSTRESENILDQMKGSLLEKKEPIPAGLDEIAILWIKSIKEKKPISNLR